MTQDTLKDFEHIPLEKFEFVNQGERISDQKFEDKPGRNRECTSVIYEVTYIIDEYPTAKCSGVYTDC